MLSIDMHSPDDLLRT